MLSESGLGTALGSVPCLSHLTGGTGYRHLDMAALLCIICVICLYLSLSTSNHISASLFLYLSLFSISIFLYILCEYIYFLSVYIYIIYLPPYLLTCLSPLSKFQFKRGAFRQGCLSWRSTNPEKVQHRAHPCWVRQDLCGTQPPPAAALHGADQAGWGWEQPGLRENVPAHGRALQQLSFKVPVTPSNCGAL